MSLRRTIVFAAFSALGAIGCVLKRTVDLSIAPREWRAVNRTVTAVRDQQITVLRFDERPGAGVALMPGVEFRDGDIDVDMKGRDVLQKSFVGVVFRMTNDSTFETVWLRPFNFRSEDVTRRAHAVQYASYPTFSWQKLRTEQPGAFETALAPAPDPNDWVHMHVEVRGDSVRAFVNGAKVLDIRSPANRGRGSVGLWVGDQSNGDFKNLVIHKSS